MQNDGPAPVNLADLVAVAARRSPDRVALVAPGQLRTELTWADLDRRVDELAAGLTATGLLAGARLALLGPNSVAFVVAYLAALRGGIVVVPLNPQSTPSELEALLADSGARVLLADPALTPAELPGVRTRPLTDDGLAAIAVPGAPVSSPRDVESLAVLLYTAGTSGRPKAAMLTHRALLAHVEHLHALGLLTPESTVLASLPLFHVFGLNAVLGGWARSGGRLVVVDTSSPESADQLTTLLREERVTNLPLAPPTLHRLLTEDGLEEAVATVQSVVSGAAPLPEELAAEFTARTGIEVAQGYGLTEAAPGVTATLGGSRRGQGHVGRALPGVQIRIGDGSEESEPAEIAIRGDNLFSGYWPDGSGGPDAAGWFPTGDIGYLEDGELYLVDRARELVIVNGFNVYPAEVEQVIGELPEVDAVAVVGRPDRRTGEEVVAFVVAEEPSQAATLAEIVAGHCEERLARFKRPTVLQVVPELPRGATGKVRKGLLRELAGNAGSSR